MNEEKSRGSYQKESKVKQREFIEREGTLLRGRSGLEPLRSPAKCVFSPFWGWEISDPRSAEWVPPQGCGEKLS